MPEKRGLLSGAFRRQPSPLRDTIAAGKKGQTMASSRQLGRIRAALDRIKKLFRKEPEPPAADPYAYVTAPRRPRPSNRGAAVAELPDE